MRFTDQDFRDIDLWVDGALELLRRDLRIKVEISPNVSEWKKWAATIPHQLDPLGVSSTLDSDVHDLGVNAFWTAFRNEDGEIIGCHCDRFIFTDDFLEEIRSGRLFRTRSVSFERPRMQLVGDRTFPTLSSRVHFGGGTWIHPNYRGMGLSNVVARLGRNFGLQEFLADYYVTLMAQRRQTFGENATGLKRGAALSQGYYTGRGKALDVHMFYMHRYDMLDQMRAECAAGIENLLILGNKSVSKKDLSDFRAFANGE